MSLYCSIRQWSAGVVLAAVAASVIPASGQEARAASATPVRMYLDSAFGIMEANVLGADTVDWDSFRDTVYGWASGAEEIADVYPVIRRALRALNPHSFLQLSPEQRAREQERHPRPAEAASAPGEGHPVYSPFSGRRQPLGTLEEYGGRRIGHVVIPAFGRGHLTAFADSIETLIRTLDAQGACGWIVDLRGNGGGNMWPMLAGIGSLLGNGYIGAFHGPRGEATGRWFYRNGVAGIETSDGEVQEIARVSGEPHMFGATPPVAVLFDGGTGSSGEAVAIAFIGRPRTRSFGVASYGFTTANDGFRLPDSANMVLTVGVDADRNGVAYPTALTPDELVPIAPYGVIPPAPPPDDSQLNSALAWLIRQPGCR
jgi:hypothetical protein